MIRNKNKMIRDTKPDGDHRSQAERRWFRHMKIWHAINNSPSGLRVSELFHRTGISYVQIERDLAIMGGVEQRGGVWFSVQS